jgi:hypothetical protein
MISLISVRCLNGVYSKDGLTFRWRPRALGMINCSPESEGESNGDAVADAIVGELGYTQSYKRAFRTIGNVALSIGISS